MKYLHRTVFTLLLISLGAPTHAQSTMTDTPKLQGTQTLQAFGGKAGLTLLMDDFVNRLTQDARIGSQFKEANISQLKEKLRDQICVILNGPCEYKGADMKTAHAQMDINKSNFNALVEQLQAAMQAKNIPFSAQNALLAKLAPMHRDVITVK
jgi:hemoglobin